MKTFPWIFKLTFVTFSLLNLFDLKAQQFNVSLTPSSFNGYNISCFGSSNGTIDLTINGGIAPFYILWSTGDSIEDLENLPAGYYNVRVTDSDSVPNFSQVEITLTEPRKLEIEGVVYSYPNGYNISVNGACNGMVNLTESGGIAPISWLWSDNNTAQNRTALCSGWYSVKIQDANGCKANKEGYLKEPSRGDWVLFGNEGTDPTVNFVGTTDSTDLVFKTNSNERLRISGAGNFEFKGDIKIDSTSIDTVRLVFVDQNGILRTYGPISGPPSAPAPDWNTKGNYQIDDQVHYLGTNNGADLVFKTATSLTSATEKMRITKEGIVGIGTVNTTLPPVNSGYKLIVDGKVGFREAYVKLTGTWPDYVFSKSYDLMSLSELRNYISTNEKLPGMLKASEIKIDGQNLGEIQRVQQEKIEELFLYLLSMDNILNDLKNENKLLKSEIKKLKFQNK